MAIVSGANHAEQAVFFFFFGGLPVRRPAQIVVAEGRVLPLPGRTGITGRKDRQVHSGVYCKGRRWVEDAAGAFSPRLAGDHGSPRRHV